MLFVLDDPVSRAPHVSGDVVSSMLGLAYVAALLGRTIAELVR